MGLMERFADPSLFTSLDFGEKMLGSTVTMIMGLGTTFIILLLLWAFIAIMGRIMRGSRKKVDTAKEIETSAAPSDAEEQPAAIAETGSDDATAAVIAAAIAAYEGSGIGNNLIVRKISRVSGEATPWSSAARDDCIDSRKI